MRIYILLLSLIISSCAPSIKSLSLYQKQYMTKGNYLPTKEQLAGKMPNIAVFDLEENGEVAKQASLGRAIAGNLENTLAKNKLAKLIDRSAAVKLEQEVRLSELNKTGSYKGPQVADYIISGAISNAGFTKKYNSASSFFNPKTGRSTHAPANFKYSSEVSGNVKVYELPSMQVSDNIDFQGYSSRTENVQSQGGFKFGTMSIGGKEAQGINRDDNLVRQAGEDAILSIELEMKNILSSRGYVLEKRTGKNFTIFKVSLGNKNGIKHGDKLKVISQFDVTNPITNEAEIEKRVVASGTISEIIEPSTSWVIIKEPKMAEKVRLGDVIKLDYARGKLSALIKKSRKFTN